MPLEPYTLTDKDFGNFQRFIYDAAGITLSSAKKSLVCGRLAKRLHARRIDSYADYFRLLQSGTDPAEVQSAVDLLTTNETYFFRESKHFDLLQRLAHSDAGRQTYRVWSAACSTGEEPYSMAMVLSEHLSGRAFEIVGTDISTRVLARARAGHYPEQRARLIPETYLKRYCLKGQGKYDGTLLIERALRDKVRYVHANLNESLPGIGMFDVIFLRNVMIYFNTDTRRGVVERVLGQLKPGGYLCIGHSESLNDVTRMVEQVAPAVYRKPL
jgi:chemotaxis protein methyltransferase CheR